LQSQNARETFLEQISNFFQQLTGDLFSIASPPTLAAHEFCIEWAGKDLMHVTVRPELAKVFKIGFYFSFWMRPATKPITAVLLLPFAVNWR
jgi:hypothetical protein